MKNLDAEKWQHLSYCVNQVTFNCHRKNTFLCEVEMASVVFCPLKLIPRMVVPTLMTEGAMNPPVVEVASL